MSRSKEFAQNVVVGTGLAGKIEKRESIILGRLTDRAGLAGATTGATIAVLKNAPLKQWTVSTGLNCGVFGATFFCEYPCCHLK